MSWRADKPASLYFVEALDGGDQSKKQNSRDEVLYLGCTFSTEPKSLMKTKQRFAGIQFGNEENAIVMDSWYDTRSQKRIS